MFEHLRFVTDENQLDVTKHARRKKNFWTKEEEAALKAGVDRFGKGKWKAIKMWKYEELKACTQVDIKDKIMNLEKKRKKSAEAQTLRETDPSRLPKRFFIRQIV
jgi:hypothetical protein